MNIKELKQGIISLYLFKKGYTFYPRWFEIYLGLMSWLSWGIIIFCIILFITNGI